jgi:Kef-type K+ transport system, predicted NAD-binding component
VAEAIGALLLGLILAETTHNKKAIQIITPLRDLFGSVFFFSFGMAINYRLFGDVAFIALGAVAATVAGNLVSGLLASRIYGYSARRGFNVAFTIMARGEFSVILASLAVTAGASPKLPSIAALYVLLLAFISPVLAKNARNFYDFYQRLKGFFTASATQGRL